MRRALVTCLALVLVLLAADYAVWRWATGRLADGYAQWVRNAEATGWTVTSGPPERAGWPSAAELAIPRFTISGGASDLPGGVTWSADDVLLLVTPGDSRTLVIQPSRAQRLALGRLPAIPITAEQMTVRAPLSQPQPESAATVDAAAVRLSLPDHSEASAGQLHARIGWSPAVAITLRAQDIALPPERRWPFGPKVESVSVIASAHGHARLGNGLAAMAASWRDSGGQADVQSLTLRWGALRLTASAKLRLDDVLQPEGSGRVRLTDPGPALDALDANHVVDPRTITAAKAFLTLLAQPAANGDPPHVELPVSLEQRTLAVGHVPVLKLPELVWPVAP